MSVVERFMSLRKTVCSIFRGRTEFPSSRTFILEAQIAARARETPPTISGTVYFSRDFVTEENIDRLRKRELERYGYVGHATLNTGAWRRYEDTWVSSTLKEINTDPDFPQDIVLAVYNNEPAHYFGAYPFLRGLLSRSGFTSHGMIVTREDFKRLEAEMRNLVVLSSVDISRLRSGDKAVINLQDSGRAKITVTRLPAAKESSSS